MQSRPGDDQPLTAFGLSPVEQSAYEMLIDQPCATLADLASSWSAADPIENVLAALEHRGMISTSSDQVTRYTAIAPWVAFRDLLLDHEAQLNAARQYLSVLDAAYQDRPGERRAGTIVEDISSERAARLRLAQLLRTARQKVRRLDRASFLAIDDAESPAADRLHRAVVYRTIYDRSALVRPGALTAVENLIREGHQARVLAQVPVGLYLIDDRVALLPVAATGEDRSGAIVVYPSALLDALVKLFEGLWRRALPLGPSPTARDRPDTTDQQRLVTLLLSGLTDEAIARQLGLSHRTVQRRVAALVAELHAHTRFQAGAQAALRGFLIER